MSRSGANKKEAIDQARRLLEKYHVTSAPVPVERIAKAEGAVVQYAPLDDELSGMAYIRDDRAIIGVNAIHHPNRQRFTVAHEIGHLVLHRSHISEQVHVDKVSAFALNRDPKAATGTDALEIEANAFAAELLMPEKILREALDALKMEVDDEAFETLAKKFRVSTTAIQNRLVSLLKAK
jgi:Zn-dependent peptidase ImmA (M78 family)